MKAYGYCCGHRYVSMPYPMICHGSSNDKYHDILGDGHYFVYTDPSGHRYTFCQKCFDSEKSDHISVGHGSAETSMNISKSDFQQAVNGEVLEAMVNCVGCSRPFHAICVLYHQQIWPEGYFCKQCLIKPVKNEYVAAALPSNKLANRLQERVDDFLRKECDGGAGRVTIRVLAASDRVCEVKPRFKKHFGGQVHDGYPYRTKAIFAFQEIEGMDVVLFCMHVQEYDSKCPGPNSK